MAYYTLVVETAVFFSSNGPGEWPFPLQKHQRMSLILVARYWFTNLKYIFNNEILLYFDVSFLLWIFEVFLKHLIFLIVKSIIHITAGIQSLNVCICFLTVKKWRPIIETDSCCWIMQIQISVIEKRKCMDVNRLHS